MIDTTFLAVHHCIAHNLALAHGQSADEITYCKLFKSVLNHHLYSNSAVRTASLAIQELLDDSLDTNTGKGCEVVVYEKAVSHLC